jgi:hypothetical protein
VDEKTWNFSAVVEAELVACCFWEYARESKAMREAVKLAKTSHNPGKSDAERQAFRDDATRANGLLNQTGLPLEFWMALPFPKPWQSLAEPKRKIWSDFRPDKFADHVKFPAFQVTGDLNTAAALHDTGLEVHKARMAIFKRLAEIDQGAANLDEAAKLRAMLAENLPLKIQGAGGVDSFIAQINWRMFSKAAIKACFNKWVDDYDCPLAKPSERGRGNTLADWRARVERLGLLRLRRVLTVDQTIKTVKAPNSGRIKFWEPKELNRDVQNAGDDFKLMFPFLSETLDCSLVN